MDSGRMFQVEPRFKCGMEGKGGIKEENCSSPLTRRLLTQQSRWDAMTEGGGGLSPFEGD